MNSELTFQAIVESSPIAILLINKEGTISYINHYGEELFGYARSEIIGKAIELIIPKRYHDNYTQYLNTFTHTPKKMAFGAGKNLYAVKENSTEFPVELTLSPIVTPGGTLILVSIIDISARKKAEHNFEKVIEEAPNAMILANSAGKIELVNKQAQKLFGYEKKEFIEKNIDTLVPAEHRKNHHYRRDSFFHTPDVAFLGKSRDIYGIKKNGEKFPAEIGLNPITIDDETYVAASIIDTTQRKEADAIIKKQMVELESKNRELEQLNYIASHDLQDPLRTILNYIGLLEEDYAQELNDDVKGYLKDMNAAVIRMTVLVKSILDFGRLGRDKKLKLTDCNKALKNVLYDLNQRIEKEKATINIQQLPEIYAYESELMQLFQNLINNAIKFKHSDRYPEINVGCSENEKEYQFYVSDNGIGINSKYYDRIFTIFQRLHTAEEYEGYGVGLANCKKIIELHGGKIWIESEQGKGTTFKFIIPKLSNG